MSDFQMKIISALRYQSTYFGVQGCLLVAQTAIADRARGPLRPPEARGF